MKQELNITKDKDLCKILEIKHNTLSTWKKRDTVDFSKVLLLCEEYNLDLNYIFFEEDLKTEDGVYPSNSKVNSTFQNSLQPLFKTKLVNTNRNISVFVNTFSEKNNTNVTEIIIGQQISLKKILEDTLYLIPCIDGELYLDKLYIIINSSIKTSSYSLKNNKGEIGLIEIESIWLVLNKSYLII
ncbi:helix-turn-helix domain-containing protein [Ulvibacter antarcticus]|uniref:Bacteriophage CI repressor-like protein n=1 Tax=Ulvibacter antarcticus TaxID=442714 RepID=A0A3L9YI16_9FLAO|nr:helix-turn-helix domain-containing protein [Ulvibacter antarcticus]RMA58849.1 bacteriophage CI repressor-like protein [Ulvibacter antarcticus]